MLYNQVQLMYWFKLSKSEYFFSEIFFIVVLKDCHFLLLYYNYFLFFFFTYLYPYFCPFDL